LSELALVVIDTLRPKLAPRLEPYVRTLEARALANVGQRRNAVKTLEEIRKSPDVPDRCRIVASTSLADVHRRGGDPYGAVRVLQEMKSEFDLDRKLEQSADSAIVNDIQTVGDPALERQSLEAFLEKWRGDMPADQEVAFRERLGHRLMEMGSHEAALAQFRSAQKLWSEQPDPESLGAVESRKAAIRDAIRSAEARLAAAERVKALIAE
jgi:hypothetical protein